MVDTYTCRICLMDEIDESLLIQPCRCSTAYVHEECLQQWRNQDIDSDNYRRCEICHQEYTIYQRYPRETFRFKAIEKYKGYTILYFYFMVLFGSSISLIFIDFIFNKTSIFLLTHDENTDFLKDKDDYDIIWFIYYLSYASYILSMLFYVYMFYIYISKIKRKMVYLNKTIVSSTFRFLLTWNYFYNYLIFYKLFLSLDMYSMASFCCIFINYKIMMKQIKKHNKTILIMNAENPESIISFNFNPMIEITTITHD